MFMVFSLEHARLHLCCRSCSKDGNYFYVLIFQESEGGFSGSAEAGEGEEPHGWIVARRSSRQIGWAGVVEHIRIIEYVFKT